MGLFRPSILPNLLLGVLVGECAWNPLAAHVVSASAGAELQDGTLGILPRGHDLFDARRKHSRLTKTRRMTDSRWRVHQWDTPHEAMGTYKDVLRVLFLDGSDDSSGNHSLLPSFGQVEVEDAISCAVVYVRFHLRVAVLSADVHLVCSTDKSILGKHETHLMGLRAF